MPRVIIIGAGISGLKAASDLIANGVKDILILEARNRIGGRLLTIKTPEGTTYDLGASWFHDSLSNPLFQKYVIEEQSAKIHFDDVSERVYNYDVGEVPEKWGLEPVVTEIEKYIEMEVFSELTGKDESLFNMVVDYIFKRRQVLSAEQAKYAPELLRYLELWHGIDWKMMSGKYSVNDTEGRNALNLDGYATILQDILSGIPENVIKTGIQVKKIVKNDDHTVTITTSKGESIACNLVIVTVPQSILALPASDDGALEFVPPLPTSISDPLKKMHFSALGKVVLEFESVKDIFWEKNVDKFIVLANPDSRIMASYNGEKSYDKVRPIDLHHKYFNFRENPENVPQVQDHPLVFLNYYTAKKAPALVVLTQSPVTNYLEDISLEEVWEFLKPALKVISNGKSLPIPKNIFKTNWTQDPFSRGSYAGCAPGDDPTDLIIGLSKGNGNVRFAGEHTIFEGAGCAHGAWLSGKREANWVMNKLGILKEEDTYY